MRVIEGWEVMPWWWGFCWDLSERETYLVAPWPLCQFYRWLNRAWLWARDGEPSRIEKLYQEIKEVTRERDEVRAELAEIYREAGSFSEQP
jgi:hypothetical protein